jgi:hypothetical protein
LKLQYDELLSTSAVKFKLRRYSVGAGIYGGAVKTDPATGAVLVVGRRLAA